MQLRPLVVTLLSLGFYPILASGADTPSVLNVRLSGAPRTLDWNIATTGSESAVIQNLMEGLFNQNASGVPQQVLAKSYTWTPDRKELKIVLRNDVKWTDGKRLESRHFLDSFERLLNPHLNSENASLLFEIEGARDYFLGKVKSFSSVGIKAPTKSTLVFSLREPRTNLLNILTHWATYPIRKGKPKLTLGPYELVSISDTRIRLKARKPRTDIQIVNFEVIPDGAKAIQAFRAQKLDYLLQLEDSLLTSPDLKGLAEPGFVDPARVVALLHLNPSRVGSRNPEARRAIMKSIPLKSLLGENFKTRTPAQSIIPAGMLGGPLLSAPSFFYPRGEIGPAPQESLTLAYPNDALSKSIAETIQKDSEGLKIKIEALPAGELSTASKRYDLVLTLFGLDYLDPDQLLSSFLSQGTHDLFNLSSAELLQIIQHARATEAPDARGKLYLEAADYLEHKVAVVMPLFYRRRAFLIRESFRFDDKRQGTVVISRIHPKK